MAVHDGKVIGARMPLSAMIVVCHLSGYCCCVVAAR